MAFFSLINLGIFSIGRLKIYDLKNYRIVYILKKNDLDAYSLCYIFKSVPNKNG